MMLSILKLFLISCILLLNLSSVCYAQSEEEDEYEDVKRAILLFSKTTEDEHVVEGKNFTVTYTIQNIGDAEALNVKTADMYDENSFELVGGDPNIEIEQIDAGDSMTFNVTIVPKVPGIYESTRAAIQYAFGTGEEEEAKVGYSSSLGRVEIITYASYIKETSQYLNEWLVFSLGFAFPIGIPLFIYNVLKTSNEKLYTPKRKMA
mmetsp:Transcript_8016/g.10443  ORF Transcript_8016/g.10443 Transcript_8016/m.10443 type:complete len:206 (-) Transcript_8016:329-946(-)